LHQSEFDGVLMSSGPGAKAGSALWPADGDFQSAI
jgi:hypothetical protein